MKALIYKDLTTTKSSIGLMTLIMVAVAFVFNKEGQLELFPLTFILLPTILLGILFGIDAESHIDKYLISTGIGKEKIVGSRYGFVWILSIFALIVSLIIGYRVKMPLALYCASVLFFSNFIALVQLPLMYKFGAEKSRMIFVFFYFLIFGSFSYFGANKEELLEFINFGMSINKNILALGLVILTILTSYISFKISARIYKAKEF